MIILLIFDTYFMALLGCYYLLTYQYVRTFHFNSSTLLITYIIICIIIPVFPHISTILVKSKLKYISLPKLTISRHTQRTSSRVDYCIKRSRWLCSEKWTWSSDFRDVPVYNHQSHRTVNRASFISSISFE